MKELIARLEAATEGNASLDTAIWATIKGYKIEWRGERCYYLVPVCYCHHGGHKHGEQHWQTMQSGGDNWAASAPSYSQSIDAALRLVPEGFPWHVWAINVESDMEYSGQVDYAKPANGATPALALCIAALKARG